MKSRSDAGSVVQVLAHLVQIAALICSFGCADPPPAQDSGEHSRLPPAELAVDGLPFQPLPRSLDLDPLKVALGEKLFSDARLSGSGTRRCVDCHDLSDGGVVPGEGRSNHPVEAGGPYNVPTVFNVAYNFRYNWQGKFESLEDHLSGPMLSAQVMNAGSWEAITVRLADDKADFIAAGYAGVSPESVKDAISIYQRSLVTPDGRFDRFLRGELVLEKLEAEGYALFTDLGCASCHQGINIGGNLFQRFGVVEDAFDRPVVERDYGRMLVTGNEEDQFVFRVPSLRNVEITAPYFHDGSAATLKRAVQRMARVQLGYDLTPQENAALVAFLKTLTGTWQGQSLSPGPLR